MNYMDLVLFLSILGNLWLGYRVYKKSYILTKDAKDVLADLASGSAVIKISVLDAAGMFYRSPRG